MLILVTGGAGFIGSAVIRLVLAETAHAVVNLDKLTYAANLDSLAAVAGSPRYAFARADICDRAAVARVLREHEPDAIMHLAAESHVDRSIDAPLTFVETNVVGTCNLLDLALDYWRGLTGDKRERFRFHHVSTDEVCGSLGATGSFRETTPYAPRSPYSASKAAADHFARAFHHTYGLPTLTSTSSNNYGPWQFPEKLVPLIATNALLGRRLPVYGTGDNVRDWLFVEDHARALLTVLESGRVGERYNIGGDAERRNLSVVEAICEAVERRVGPLPDGRPRRALIELVTDRPGHDHRYAVDASKIRAELGWIPRESFETGLDRTVGWYVDNAVWWQGLSTRYRGQRLGLRSAT